MSLNLNLIIKELEEFFLKIQNSDPNLLLSYEEVVLKTIKRIAD